MSAGNLKTQGNKGNNFPFQFRNLQLLGEIAASVAGIIPPGGLATEATALSILAAIQNGRDFEQNLVIDTGGVGCPANCPTYVEIRIWNGVGFDPPTYYNAAGAVVVPVGPLEYVNPQFTLEDILQQSVATNALLTTIDADTSNLDVALSTRATEATQLLSLAQLTAINADLDVALSTRASEATLAAMNAKFVNGNDIGDVTINNGAGVAAVNIQDGGNSITVDGTVSISGVVQVNLDATDDQVGIYGYLNGAAGSPLPLNVDANGMVAIQDGGGSITVDAVSLPLPTGAATEATLALVEANTSSTNAEVTNLNTPVTGLAVNMLRSSAASSVTAGKRSMAFYNAGAANATVAGATLKPGESVSFSADGLRDVLAAVNYDGTGTDLLITSVG